MAGREQVGEIQAGKQTEAVSQIIIIILCYDNSLICEILLSCEMFQFDRVFRESA